MKVFAVIGWVMCLTVGMIGIHESQLRDDQIREKDELIHLLERRETVRRERRPVATTTEKRIDLDGTKYHIRSVRFSDGRKPDVFVSELVSRWDFRCDSMRIWWRFDACPSVELRESIGIVISKPGNNEIVGIIPASHEFLVEKVTANEPVTDQEVVRKVMVKAGLVPAC